MRIVPQSMSATTKDMQSERIKKKVLCVYYETLSNLFYIIINQIKMTLFSGIYMRGRRKKCVSKSILIFGSVFSWLFLNSSPTFLSIYNHNFSVILFFFSHVFHTCQLQTVFSSLSTKKSLVNFHFFHSSLIIQVAN